MDHATKPILLPIDYRLALELLLALKQATPARRFVILHTLRSLPDAHPAHYPFVQADGGTDKVHILG